MYNETNAGNSYKVHVICPKCNKSDYILIPKSTLATSGRGLTKILVPDTTICDDSFQIFVDKNGAVRGYETPDFELKFSPMEEKKEELGEKGALQVIKSLFGDEIFYKCMRNAFYKNTICCITESKYITDNLRKFLTNIFGELDIQICSLDDYNNNVRQEIFASKYKNVLLFNADLQAIIKQPYKGSFAEKNFMVEKSLIDSIDFSASDDEIMEYLISALENIEYSAEELQKDIKNERIKSKRDFETRLNSLVMNSIKISPDIMADILLNKYNYNWKK